MTSDAIGCCFRYDKIGREVREKEESLAKARLDLNAELQAAGGVSVAAAPSPQTPSAAAAGFSGRAAAGVVPPLSPGGGGASTPIPLSPGDSVSGRGGGSGAAVRRDGPWVLESLGLGQQVRGNKRDFYSTCSACFFLCCMCTVTVERATKWLT